MSEAHLRIQAALSSVFLVLYIICQIPIIACQSFPVPFLRTTSFPHSGNTLWAFNNFISKQAYLDFANNTSIFNSVALPGILEMYDRNRRLSFRLENMPKIYSAEHSLFLPFFDDGFAHFYRESGDQTLFLRIYNKNGTPLTQPQSLPQRVDAFDAAVTSEEPLRIMLAVARIVKVNNITDITIYQFDRTGAQTASPEVLASGFLSKELLNSNLLFQPTISTSVTADGSFMVSWVSKTSVDVNLIRTAYIKDGKPPARAFIVASSQTTGLLMIVKCDAIAAGDGHFCVYDEFTPSAAGSDITNRSTFITQFSYSGSLFNLPTNLGDSTQDRTALLNLSLVFGLPYGGLFTLTPFSTTPVSLYNRWWNNVPFTDSNIKLEGVTVLPNNTILSLNESDTINPGDWIIQGYKVFSTDLPNFLNRSNYDNNPNIVNAEPALGSIIDINRSDFTIYFLDSNYTVGLGKIKIYSEDSQYPRESINLEMSTEISTNYSFAASQWTFNTPENRYYITIEGGSFKSAIGEPLPGIGPRVWTLQTRADPNREEKDGVKIQVRLNTNNPGNSARRGAISSGLCQDLTSQLPIESKRIQCSYLRNTELGEIYQVKLRKIGIDGRRTAYNLANEFSLMVQNKDRSPLNYGEYTHLIDPSFGIQREESLFKDNWGSLVAIIVAVLAVIVGFAISHRKFPNSDNSIIFILALSLFDFIADLLFVISNSFDIPKLAAPSILFLTLPFSFNLVSSTYIIVKEVSNNPLFHEWFARHTLVTSLVSILAATNPVLLNILRSRFLGFNSLCAPFSSRVTRMILFCTAIGVVLEDIPQLIIQSIYKTSNGYFKLFPFLSLVTSCLAILYSVITHFYNFVAWKQQSKRSQEPKLEEERFANNMHIIPTRQSKRISRVNDEICPAH